jgi:hypothetical protein
MINGELEEADTANGSVIAAGRSKNACPSVSHREEMHPDPAEQVFRGRQSRMYLRWHEAQDWARAAPALIAGAIPRH